MMYSAAIAPQFRHLSARKKWLFSYLLVDHAFALLSARFPPGDTTQTPGTKAEQQVKKNRDDYYFGGTSFLWVMWQISNAIGVFAGTLIPGNWSLDFAIPLVFLALVLPALQSRTHWLTALVAVTAAAFTTALPMKLGLITAAVAGVAVGAWLDSRAVPVK